MKLHSTDVLSEALRILIVDDNAASAKTLSWMVEEMGHVPRVADKPFTATPVAMEFKPEVLLLDLGLPGINGYELCALLRSDPAFKDALFIAQTGWAGEEHFERSKRAGFNYHLVKPVDMEELRGLIEDFARKRAEKKGV